MAKQADIQYRDDVFYISGDLDFSNITSLYKKSKRFLQNAKALTFDFSALTSSNSAGLALMVEWVKEANSHQQAIAFVNMPNSLRAIVEMAGLQAVILK